jgi:amino-acid N-acetyltransferase
MIRKATINDIKSIHRILQYYGDKGEMLARPLSQLYDHLRDFSVYEEEGEKRVVGCCALQFCWEDLAEIRSLAIEPEFLGRGIGAQLARLMIAEAKNFGINRIFTLTYKPQFFKKLGFVQIEHANLPLKIWSDCIICVKFPDCDETAMMMELE